MKFALKVVLCLLINAAIVKFLFINTIDRYSGKSILVKQVYSKPGYQYWSIVDGVEYCSTKENPDRYKDLPSFADKKTTVVYFKNVSLLDCIDNLKEVSTKFHNYDLEVAFPIENDFDKAKAVKADTGEIIPEYYTEKYKKALEANDYVDYIVHENAHAYFTFDERRQVQVVLRDIFKKPFIGFAFSNEYGSDPATTHPHRSDKQLAEFMPRDDDGDFIITGINVPSFKRTLVIVADQKMDKIGVDGEVLEK
jgi:hypothetical protein